MNTLYNPREIEKTVQEKWLFDNKYKVLEDAGKPKFYCLSMFPYPSGKLHMGHVRNYTIGDVLSRYHRMRGYNVLQPMGWDAFGLPAENAAMANKVPPAKWTYQNIDYMKQQLKSLGFALDWTREIATCKPEYYKWNQWLFLRMLEKGLVYKKTGTVNWDPVDQTVLANEQVIDGRGWRTGALVERREVPMYYMKISNYAQELLTDLDQLDGWPVRVKTMQSNWIGKSEGVNVTFEYKIGDESKMLRVFTTRVDTVMGVTFCAVAPEHPLAIKAANSSQTVATFIKECGHRTVTEAELAVSEKKGVFTGFYVDHPLSKKKIPVWVGNYVLMNYGEGAVMGVPAHDERDFNFAKKYNLEIIPVIEVKDKTFSLEEWRDFYTDRGICINSGKYDGLSFQKAIDSITEDLVERDLGERQSQWRLRDWGISRQRYWGTPIPIIHCAKCGDVPVPDDQLPVVLPEDCVPDGSGNPLNKREDFVLTQCPSCGEPAKRETDTMDTFVDSSWYPLRYACPDNGEKMVDERVDYWLPVDQYVGGIEHAILHLLYSRFWIKVMRDLDLISIGEPFENLLTQGMVLNEVFSRKANDGRINYFNPLDVEFTPATKDRKAEAILRSDRQPVFSEGIRTMSKSKNNGVDPQSLIDEYGADTARLFIMFSSPPEDSLTWNSDGVEGSHRFLRKLWRYSTENKNAILSNFESANANDLDPKLLEARRLIHQILQQATNDYQRKHFNTVVSACMKLLNVLDSSLFTGQKSKNVSMVMRDGLGILIRILYPITPHITTILWEELEYGEDLTLAEWPEVDKSALAQSTQKFIIQINGKRRGEIEVLANAEKSDIEAAVLASDEARKYTKGKKIKKIIIVPGRLVNVVIES